MCESLQPEEVRYIHNQVLEAHGGLPGEKDPGMIDYICEKPFAFDRYPLLFEKAAVLMIGIATGHYFFDGNKRTAAMCTYVFLIKNGYEIIVSDEDLFRTTVSVAKKEISQRELTIWLADNSHMIDESEFDNIEE